MAAFKLKQTLVEWNRLLASGLSFACRSPREAVLALRMAAWIVIISGMVKVSTLTHVLSVVTPHNQAELKEAEIASAHFRLAQLIDRLLTVNLLVFTPNCWKRAVVLHRYLSLYGIRNTVVFGVRKDQEGGLAGHAWLEVQGQPIFESSPPDFLVTYSFPVQYNQPAQNLINQ